MIGGDGRYLSTRDQYRGMESSADESALPIVGEFETGFTWIADQTEQMQRASHAIRTGESDVWVIDPVDTDGLDAALADLGDVRGVVLLLDRHKRDVATVAARHDVPVYIPAMMDGVADAFDVPIKRFAGTLAETDFEAHILIDNRFWQEVALYDPTADRLVVPEAVGTAPMFLSGNERLGVSPALRLTPPRDQLGQFSPEQILVGHGPPVLRDGATALKDALDGARRQLPHLAAKTIREFVSG